MHADESLCGRQWFDGELECVADTIMLILCCHMFLSHLLLVCCRAENYNIYRAKKKLEFRTNILADLTAKKIDPKTVDVDSQVDAAFDAHPVDFTKLPRNN